MKILILFVGLLMGAQAAWADTENDEAFLDPAYENLVHPMPSFSSAFESFKSNNKKQKPKASDTVALIAKQSPVKSQGSRGTCSIFSAAAMLESMLIIKNDFPTDIDLSEEWLEYLVMKNRDSDGSHSYRNFSAIAKHGMPYEETLPYIGQTWKDVNDSPLAQERCGDLDGLLLDSCLLGHRDQRLIDISDDELLDNTSDFYDPEFFEARAEAEENRMDFIQFENHNFMVYRQDDIKALLDQGIPMTMGIEFYYGAWNHRVGMDVGIPRNLEHWGKGIVGYPQPGSVDYAKSPTKRAGHSVLIVGYDDAKTVDVEMLMEDGTKKTFTYKGVYYFKNSWGSGSFGVDFELNGKKYPGYGMITQKYAHEQGSFYKMPLKKQVVAP